MARRDHIPEPTKKAEVRRHCRECAFAYDFQCPGADGRPILCRCDRDERSKHGKYCKLASDRACELFELSDKTPT